MPRKGSTRRLLLQGVAATGGGFALGVAIPGGVQQTHAKRALAQMAEPEVTAWLQIGADDLITVRVARSEMGQGTATGLAQLVAEELGCDWSKVKIDFPTPGQNLARQGIWRDFVTSGSRGIRTSQEYMRTAGAAARHMLLGAAAAIWKVPAAELTSGNGLVLHRRSGRVATYGRLAPFAAKLAVPEPQQLRLSEPSKWRIAGKRVKRLDTADKLNGRAVFGIDVKLPGMLSAAIKDCPVFGGTIGSFDAAAIATKPGVRYVLKAGETAVAVVADTWWQAHQALSALPITWQNPPDALFSSESIAESLKEGLETRDAFIGTAHGDALKAIASSRRSDAIYSMPFLHHATLEPMNATALWTPERVEVWAPTQNADGALKVAAQAAGLPVAQAEIYRTHIGGGFGRRTRHDYIRQAVEIARQIPGVPVKLLWSREEDTAHGFYRPATQCRLSGGVDDKGEIAGLIMRVSGQSIIASQTPKATQSSKDPRMFQGFFAEAGEAQIGYSIPNLYIDHAMRRTPVPVGSWRGVHSTQNAIYLECFVDELAKSAGRDPYEFRRSMMKAHPNHLAVLTAAAEKARWSQPDPPGIFRGLAQAMAYGSYCAAVAEVSVSADGKPKVHRVVMAIDAGQIVNPDLVEAQLEGSVAFALSALLHQEITIKDGRVVEANFDSYDVLRLAEMPVVECVLVPSGDFWGGVGEAAIGVVAPAVLNAICAATGKRVRTLPLKNIKLI